MYDIIADDIQLKVTTTSSPRLEHDKQMNTNQIQKRKIKEEKSIMSGTRTCRSIKAERWPSP